MDKLCALLASPKGFWCLLPFFLVSLASSLMVRPTQTKEPSSENQPADITECLAAAAHLMKEADDALHHFQETFTCTMEQIQPDNPNNEEKIMAACMPGFCMPEAKDAVDQDHCRDTIYKILKQYKVNSSNLLNAVNNMMQTLKSDHKITEQRATEQHPLKKIYGNDFKQCLNLLILQQLSRTIHRTFMNLPSSLYKYNAERN